MSSTRATSNIWGKVSGKEKTRLAALIALAAFTLVAIVYLKPMTRPIAAAKSSPAIQHLSLPVAPLPFTKNEAILQAESDDDYLKTEGFYYLLHQMFTTPPTELSPVMPPHLAWKSIAQPSSWPQLRGKPMRLRGCLAHVREHVLQGKEAKACGIEGGTVWECSIYSVKEAKDLFYLCFVTQLPPQLHLNDDVEITGAFLKMWSYQSQNDKATRAPVFIAKDLRILPRQTPAGPLQFSWIIVAMFSAMLLLLLASWWQSKKNARAKRRQPQPRSL